MSSLLYMFSFLQSDEFFVLPCYSDWLISDKIFLVTNVIFSVNCWGDLLLDNSATLADFHFILWCVLPSMFASDGLQNIHRI